MAERKSVLLRLDPAVHDALTRWANDDLRSTNAQIEFLLRRALAEAGRLPGGTGAPARRGRPRKAARKDGEPQEPDPTTPPEPPPRNE
ncbi:hypothetical protein KCV87_14390 [Actinosynnema pretiosum subsp. pretiosum]|uniref:Arc-like DNA binding domain-containing protein n=2 Tax=Actinosynnema TaxID=40566 RepID=C6WRB0_ACTMD|nr:hypothetical protein [Actinosynnema mirum]ACU35162.1 hypothetical protein Amir_1210 [Actinosynnema mirum DSM 43827]AXX28541.1 hypothetical protein APASM_1176 [Actinosynnema pretiosum subsp. pretiosum]QUF07121.1 hypothetical protein KCV87_14390 [Actinosynnema pretiosum subsp. pretiosum]